MEEFRVQPAHLASVSRTSPDTGGQREHQHPGRDRGQRRTPTRVPLSSAWTGPADESVRVEPVFGANGQVIRVRLYGNRSGKFLGEMSPEELKQFATRHQTYQGVLVERQL